MTAQNWSIISPTASASSAPLTGPCSDWWRATDLLGVRKWEPPVPVGMGGKVKGGFPGFLPKTDETRVQVLEPVLQRHRGKTFYLSQKLDGTSFTAFVRQGEFGICSRNLWMAEVLGHITTAEHQAPPVALLRGRGFCRFGSKAGAN